jgi:hypothetical protein
MAASSHARTPRKASFGGSIGAGSKVTALPSRRPTLSGTVGGKVQRLGLMGPTV